MKPMIKMVISLCVMAVVAIPSVVSASTEEVAHLQSEQLGLQHKICIVHKPDCNKQCVGVMTPPCKPELKPDEKPSEPELKPDEKPSEPDEKPSEPELKPDEKPSEPELKPDEKPSEPELKPDEKPSEPELKPDEKPSEPGETLLDVYEQKVAELVNQRRAEQGLAPLLVSKELSKVAEAKAADMRDANYFSHTSPTYGSPFEMMKQFGLSYRGAAENIAKGQKTPESVMDGWMGSQGHRTNILSANYTEIGVGYVTDSKGMTYWVQMFRRP